MNILRGHYFKPDDPKDKDPQELKCICGATLSLTDSENSPRVRGWGWYLIRGPYACPISKEAHKKREEFEREYERRQARLQEEQRNEYIRHYQKNIDPSYRP